MRGSNMSQFGFALRVVGKLWVVLTLNCYKPVQVSPGALQARVSEGKEDGRKV